MDAEKKMRKEIYLKHFITLDLIVFNSASKATCLYKAKVPRAKKNTCLCF